MKNYHLLLLLLTLATVSFSFKKPPSGKPAASRAAKSLAFPVAGTKSYIKDKWGASRAGGLRKHKGIDIHARKGTPVVAVSDGVIVNRDHTVVGGKTLWLKSAQHGWTAYYAHLDNQYVKEGQHVRKGQVIGTVGNTGNARTTPAHLHFGVSKDKNWVNPLPIVKHAPKVAAPKATAQKKKAPAKKRTYAKRSKR